MIAACRNKAQPASKLIACCTDVSRQCCNYTEAIVRCSCPLAQHPSAIKLSIAKRLQSQLSLLAYQPASLEWPKGYVCLLMNLAEMASWPSLCLPQYVDFAFVR